MSVTVYHCHFSFIRIELHIKVFGISLFKHPSLSPFDSGARMPYSGYHDDSSQIPLLPPKASAKHLPRTPSEEVMLANIYSAFGFTPSSTRSRSNSNSPVASRRSKSDRTSPPIRDSKNASPPQPQRNSVDSPKANRLSLFSIKPGNERQPTRKLRNDDAGSNKADSQQSSPFSRTYDMGR